jgi:hypothetical protein
MLDANPIARVGLVIEYHGQASNGCAVPARATMPMASHHRSSARIISFLRIVSGGGHAAQNQKGTKPM